MIRSNKERNKGQGDPRLMKLFNSFIGDLHLREIYVSGLKFTWSNKQQNPTLVKLDRILATSCWDTHFKSAFAWSKARVGSDHSPLVLDTGERRDNKAKYFYFQENWIESEGFKNLIKDKWSDIKTSFPSNCYSLDVWHGCLQTLRKYLRGWDLRNKGVQKLVKMDLTKRVEEIDLIAEQRLLTMGEWEERIDLENKIENLDRQEDLQWKQKAGKNWVLLGDANTRFFHQFCNGRRRKKTITVLDSENGDIRGQKNITNHIVDYYKLLFGHNDPCFLRVGGDFLPQELRLNDSERESLICPFSMEEIKGVIMEMKENSAPGPNGFSVSFFKNYWEVIKDDVWRMFQDFWENKLDIKRLNYGVITLVPKIKDANTIKQFRPICLLNVDYKWFTKVLTNRLIPVTKRIIGKNQTGFIKGRNILEGVVVLHEVLHELHKSKARSLVLKIDFEKAYDRVRWDFLEKFMAGKGFPPKWIEWVMSTVKGGKVCINVNGERSEYFKTFRGLRQGDPLSPLLFNMVADALGVLLQSAISKGHLS